MGLWLEILIRAGRGDSYEAYRLLEYELPLALRYPEHMPRGGYRYVGPVAKAVHVYAATLPDSDRGMCTSRSEDLIDYITDLIIASVRRTLALVECCHAGVHTSTDEIAEGFAGWDGLKRSLEQKKEWITDHLRSMNFAGVPLPPDVAESIGNPEDSRGVKYAYNEIALARRWRVDLSWKDFKEQQELDANYLCITDPDANESAGVGEEGFEYGSISVANVVLNLSVKFNAEDELDINRIGANLSAELHEMMELLHEEKPTDGYRPIAWHNVWWNIMSEYEGLPLKLETREPLCEVDHVLAAYLAENYVEVLKPKRLNVYRRRKRLYDSCVERVGEALFVWSDSPTHLAGSEEI